MRKILVLVMFPIIVLSLFIIGCNETVVPDEQEETSVENQQEERQPRNEIILLVKGDLAEHLGVQLEEIKVISVESVEWNDASLGVPGVIAAQVITPGYIITLTYDSTEHVYHTDTEHSFVRITEDEKDLKETVHDPEPTIPLLQVTVTRVVDGDTIHVDLNGETEKIRVIGIDTPETVHPSKPVEPFGPEASAFAKEKLDGREVWLELDVSERCRFGRLLAYVWVKKPVSNFESEVRSKMFNALILLEGLAQVSTFPPNVKYVDMFTKFQKEARELGRGIWGAEQPPEATPEIPPEQAGDIIIQGVDLFGELVIIKNTSGADIDMTGWRLVSVEGNQMFTFPAGFVLKVNSTVEIDSGPGAAGDRVNSLRWTGSHIWNNDGDPAELYDAQENKVAEY